MNSSNDKGTVRNLKFYCPAHRIRFQAAGEGVIACEQGGHAVGSGFPAKSWWEFCCDCETFWPSDPPNGSLQRTECLVCERVVAKRYVCTGCQVVSIESSALVRRKIYSIQTVSGIAPNCPGCYTAANGSIREHECEETNVPLLTCRVDCPFCDKNLGAPVAVKTAPESDAKIFCPFCGAEQKPSNRFCKRCGKALPNADEQARARAEVARLKAKEIAALQEVAEVRRRAAAEALRQSEEQRVRQQQAKRKAEEEKERAEQETRRKAEQERLAKELQLRLEEEAARRAAEAALLSQVAQPSVAAETNTRQLAELEEEEPCALEPVGLKSASDPERDVGTLDQAPHDSTVLISEPDPIEKFTPNELAVPSQDELLNREAPFGKANIAGAAEYVPSWHTPSPVTVPRPRRMLWFWIATLLGLILIVVTAGAIFLKPARNNSGNAASSSTPATTKPGIPAGMVLVQGGEFLMGSNGGSIEVDDKPAHKVTVASFYIDTTEVTCEDYQKFVKATGHQTPANWIGGVCLNDDLRKPVTGVDWYDASAYAKWFNKRLPTEEEWEFAARGTDGRLYPWGNEWRPNAANAGTSSAGQFADVGSHPDGKSPFGVMDMVGNAWEWTASEWKGYPGGHAPPDASSELRVIRGGFFGSSIPKATTTFRRGWDARGSKEGYKNTGFRCAKDW